MAREPILGWKRDVVILVVLQVVLGLVCLKTVPRFYQDEAWEASLGHSLAYEGRLRHGIIEGWGGIDIHFVQNQVVLPVVCAAIYRLAGFGITSSRIGSVFISAMVIISIYGVARFWFGRRQAMLMGFATILYPWFFEVSRRVRPEIYYMALCWGGCWCLIHSLHKGRYWSAILAGVLAGWAGLAHPIGFVLDFAMFIAVVVWQRRRTIKKTVLWAAVGFTAGVLPYVIYVLWCIQDPQINFWEQMTIGSLQRSIVVGEIIRWKHFFQWPKGIPLAVIIVASWFFGWYRSRPGDKIAATAIGIFVITMPFVAINDTSRYLVAISPLFCILLVRLVCRITAGGEGRWLGGDKYRVIVSGVVAGIYLIMSLAAISIMFYRLHNADLDRLLGRVASVVNPEERVYGEMIFWMGSDRYCYGPYPIEFREGTWQQDIETVINHRFDYAVRTAWLFTSSYGVASPPVDMPAFRRSYTLDEVCRRFGTKVYEFRDPYFGPVEIYKLNWGSNSVSGNELRK